MDDRKGWQERVRDICADGVTWWWWWSKITIIPFKPSGLAQVNSKTDCCQKQQVPECVWNSWNLQIQTEKWVNSTVKIHQGVGECATPFPGLLPFTLDMYLIMLSVKHRVPFFESLVWLDLGLNPGILDHWWETKILTSLSKKDDQQVWPESCSSKNK